MLTYQSFFSASGSLAWPTVLATLHFSKYSPLMPSTSGEEARYIEVCAPFSGVPEIKLNRNLINGNLSSKWDLVSPGCRQLIVTPDPSSFLDNSFVKRTRPSLVGPT